MSELSLYKLLSTVYIFKAIQRIKVDTSQEPYTIYCLYLYVLLKIYIFTKTFIVIRLVYEHDK